MNVKVEYEATPIRHIAVECPECGNWFYGRDITEDKLSYSYEIYYAQFKCPVCGRIFGADAYNKCATLNIDEVSYPEIYKDCLEKKVVWE